jgi:hypothetical protein
MVSKNLVDIKENDIVKYDRELLPILLRDHSSKRNIIWATDNYASMGKGYQPNDPIRTELITGDNGDVIKPRVRKTREEQTARTKGKAEVFTPSWICNKQSNLVDSEWLGAEGLFNEEHDKSWTTNPNPIPFPTADGKTWQDYVESTRLEITCGEAPYLVSRYDTITGKAIAVSDRIGLLDRKLRVVTENTRDEAEWYQWAVVAYKCIYGYEWQGDNVLIARENLLFTFIDHYKARFGTKPASTQLREIAEIISWNIWQMDGLKGVIPCSCHDEQTASLDLFGGQPETSPCPGCAKNDIRRHNGIYSLIMDWGAEKPIKFISLIKNNKK